MLIALLVVAYFVGVGVTLEPTIKANWSTVPASQFVEVVAAELPRALFWPATAYRSIAENPGTPEKPSAAVKSGAVEKPSAVETSNAADKPSADK